MEKHLRAGAVESSCVLAAGRLAFSLSKESAGQPNQASAAQVFSTIGDLAIMVKDGKYGKCVFGNAEAIITDCIWAVADQNNNQSIYYIKDDRNPYNTGTSMISAFNGLYKDIEWGYGFDLYFENDVLYLMYKRRDEGGLGKLSMQVKIKMI